MSASEAAVPRPRWAGRGLSVLLIGGGPDDVAALTLTLHAVGCDLATAADGPGAVAAVRDGSPEVVILVGEPAGGYEAVERIVAAAGWRKPLVVALADRGTADGSRKARAAGAHLYAEKPVGPGLLVGLVRRFRSLLADVEGFDPAI